MACIFIYRSLGLREKCPGFYHSLICCHKVWEEHVRPIEVLPSLSQVCTAFACSLASCWMPSLLPAQISSKNSYFSSSADVCLLLEASALFPHAVHWGFTCFFLVKDEQAPSAMGYSAPSSSTTQRNGHGQSGSDRHFLVLTTSPSSSPHSRSSWMAVCRPLLRRWSMPGLDSRWTPPHCWPTGMFHTGLMGC